MTEPRPVRVPGDKSLTHRALMLAALSDGTCTIRRPLDGADTRSTVGALRALGCTIDFSSEEAIVRGRGVRGLTAPDTDLDCGNSGTTARLLLGILAGHAFEAVLTGDASLRSRPMRRVLLPLAAMGAHFDELGEADRLPVRMRGGALHGIHYDSPQSSAQVKSAVLLAGLTAGVPVSVSEPVLSRDHTERMLQRLGVPLLRETRATGAFVALEPVDHLPAFEFEVPGDFSSAAFMLALACSTEIGTVCIQGVGLNPARTGLLTVLRRMGASIRVENQRDVGGEPVGDIVAERSRLTAAHVSGAEVPSLVDEIPVLAVLAARADGTTVIEGAGELRAKESDRIRALVENLHAIGVTAEERPDGLVVHGTQAALAGRVRALHDHRIAMAFGVLGAGAGADIDIDDRSVVDVSFPGFWALLDELTAGADE